MRRRDLLGAMGVAAAASIVLSRTASAQRPSTRTIGFFSPVSLEGNVDLLPALRRGLQEEGFVEGENLTIVYRFADNRRERLPVIAAELLRQRVNAIVTHAGGSFAAKAATKTTPVVFTVAEDPVRTGLVASLARPGSNLTGVNFVSAELVAKRIELLHQLVPSAKRIAVLINPVIADRVEVTMREARTAATALGLEVQSVQGTTSREINEAFASVARDRFDALMIGNDPFLTSRRVQLVQLAARYGIPTAYAGRWYPEVGGLMSYGADLRDAFRQMGAYTGRILKGAKPSDLPVVQASKFELVINAETARMLGIAIPSSMLAAADEIIE